MIQPVSFATKALALALAISSVTFSSCPDNDVLAALWTRDFASMVENAGDLMPQECV